MLAARLWTSVCMFQLVLCLHYKHDYRGFDDSILYEIEWPGKDFSSLEDLLQDEKYSISSTKDEAFTCHIPPLKEVEGKKTDTYSGPPPSELLRPLFLSDSCSYRIDSYWTYEVCHGSYIKQFHEERDRIQEYYLGKFDKTKLAEKEAKEAVDEKYPYKKIDGNKMAYYEVQMSDGTLCDLNNEPRMTRVLYVCYVHGKNEIYSLKETSTCNYEVIILTPSLCTHPLFKGEEASHNRITCLPEGDSGKKPEDLYPFEVSAAPTKDLTASPPGDLKNKIVILKYDEKDGTLKMELMPNTEYLTKLAERAKIGGTGGAAVERIEDVVTDTTPVKDFLSGKHCLTGGTGWWKYEFCYGRYVRQFHGETSLILGFFDEDKHKAWIESHKQKTPKPLEQRKQLSHFYQGGTVCDKTGKKRETEVVLKCMEHTQSPSRVSLYLLEPQTCQYILGVESPLICDILAQADPATGLIPGGGEFQAPDTVEQFTIEDAMDELQGRLEND